MIGMNVKGANEVQKLFNQLERKESAKITRKITREFQKDETLKDAKLNASEMVGGEMGAKLSKSLAVRAMTKMKRGSYGAKTIIKPTDFFVHITDDGTRYYIPNAIEYGHGYPGRSGSKDVVPIPFMRKAYEENRYEAAKKLAKMFSSALEIAVRQNRRSR